MCVVGQEGVEGVVTSCVTKCQEGMVINTKDELAEKIRKLSCDFMFKTHPAECTGCPKYGKCQLASISQYVGDTGRKLKANPINAKANTKNPVILHEMHRCILCGRCVRACGELRGVGAIKFAKVNGRQQVVIDGDSLKDAGCRFCTACVEVCPTGSIREHPEIAEKLEGKTREEGCVPCRFECPAHVDVPRYIRFIDPGNYAAANAVVREKLPFPHSLGYICVHDCETACKHAYLNEPISIRNLKRFAAQHDDGEWKKQAFHKPATGKKIAVVGGGPAGLTVAYYAAKLGHSVTVFEEREKLGGQLRYGIPAYRLPRDVLDKEIGDILEAGDITVKTGTAVENAPALLDRFDAVFAAGGTHQGLKLPIAGVDLEGVQVNAQFLREFEEGTANVGKHVVILGGGNVAIDCAGAAFRLGAETVDMGGSDWGSLVQMDHGMLAMSPMWKIIDNDKFQWSKTILMDDEALARAHQIGVNLAKAAEDIEHATWQGPEGVCPHCHTNNFYIEPGTTHAICGLCGMEGELIVADGKVSINYPQEQYALAHDSMSGKLKHGQDIQYNEGRLADLQKNSEEFKARKKKYMDFIQPTYPGKE